MCLREAHAQLMKFTVEGNTAASFRLQTFSVTLELQSGARLVRELRARARANSDADGALEKAAGLRVSARAKLNRAVRGSAVRLAFSSCTLIRI